MTRYKRFLCTIGWCRVLVRQILSQHCNMTNCYGCTELRRIGIDWYLKRIKGYISFSFKYEPRYENTSILHMRKQRRRSAVQ